MGNSAVRDGRPIFGETYLEVSYTVQALLGPANMAARWGGLRSILGLTMGIVSFVGGSS